MEGDFMCRIICREMCEQDLQQVVLIEEKSFSRPWTMKDFADTLELDDTFNYVAQVEENGEIAGYCLCYQSVDEGDIANVAVKESMRRQGIAKKMLLHAIRCGRERGIKKLFLEVRISNVPAIALYRSLGFEVVGKRRNYYTDPVEDAWVMLLELS